MTFKKILFYLAYDYFLSAEYLMKNLNINKDEYEDMSKNFKRTIQNQAKYLEKIQESSIYQKYLIEFIVRGNQGEGFGLDDIIGEKGFRFASRESCANYIMHLVRQNVFLAPFILSNLSLKEEILAIVESEGKNKILSKSKFFKGNPERIEKLHNLAKNIPIEEIALEFNKSPYIIKQELILTGKGGFWENENIRTGYPFFLRDVEVTEFSLEELYYIVEDSEKNETELAHLLHTDVESIEKIRKGITNLKQYYSEEEIKGILAEKTLIDGVEHGNEFRKILAIRKDNKNYLYNFPISEMFNLNEANQLNEFFEEIKKNCTSYKSKQRHVVIIDENNQSIQGLFVEETPTKIKYSFNHKQFEIDKRKIKTLEII